MSGIVSANSSLFHPASEDSGTEYESANRTNPSQTTLQSALVSAYESEVEEEECAGVDPVFRNRIRFHGIHLFFASRILIRIH